MVENPYSYKDLEVGAPISAYQFMTAKIRVWNEGHTAGKAEQAEELAKASKEMARLLNHAGLQAEIVSELVEAARTSLRLAGKGEQFVGEAALHASYVYNLIAKAKGE